MDFSHLIGSCFASSGLADQERAQGHSHCMESQRTHKSTEVGEPFRTGEDPSHHICYSDKADHQQQDTNDPQYDFHFAPPSQFSGEKSLSPGSFRPERSSQP
jgi:hypothetical protein